MAEGDQSLEKEPTDDDVVDLLRDSTIPEIYFNGFSTFLAPSDVFVVLYRNGYPAAKLNLSYTTAKTLAVQLEKLIADLEEDSGRKIMTIDDVPEQRSDE